MPSTACLSITLPFHQENKTREVPYPSESMAFFLAISMSLVSVNSSPSSFFLFCMDFFFSALSHIILFPRPVLPLDTYGSMHGPGKFSASFPTCWLPVPAPSLSMGPVSTNTNSSVSFVHSPSFHSHLLWCDFVCAKGRPRIQS